MLKFLQNWLLARKLNKLMSEDIIFDPRHESNIVQEKHDSYKLGSCTITNFRDDKASRDAAIVNTNAKGAAQFRYTQQKYIDKSADLILSTPGIDIPDTTAVPTPKVSIRRIKVGWEE